VSSKKSKKSPASREHARPSVSPEASEFLEQLERDLGAGVSLETATGTLRERLAQSPALYQELVEALVDRAREWSAPVLNLLIQDASGKEERKHVKRALYRLRQKGIVWEEPEAKEESIWKPPPVPKPHGMLSLIDGEGERMVIIDVPIGFSKSLFMDAVVNDREGLINYRNRITYTKNIQYAMEEFFNSSKDVFIKIDPAYCRFILEEARDISLRKGKELPRDFIEDIDNMARLIPKMEVHPLYQRVDKEQLRSNPLSKEEIIALLEADTTPIPTIDLSILDPYFQEYMTATESRIILSEFQQTTRKEEIYRRAVADIFGRSEKKHGIRRRLEEIGYFTLVKGFEKEARAFVAAALEVEEGQTGESLTTNSLLMALVRHSLEVHREMQHEKKEEEKNSLLIRRPRATLIDKDIDFTDD